MLTIKFITENANEVITRLATKRYDATTIVSEVISLDALRRNTQTKLDEVLSDMNNLSKQIGDLYKQGKKEEADKAKLSSVELKEASKELADVLADSEQKLHALLVQIPNLPHTSVPEGKGADDNVVERTGGVMPKLADNALPHWDLAKKYDLIDFELGVKIAGAGFPIYKGKGAQLQRALINFFLSNASAAGYLEIQPPYMVNAASGYGTGQLPDKDGQMYHDLVDDLYLIP
nr:serine--tRNA ligase [Paludibacteraceae bacterium]